MRRKDIELSPAPGDLAVVQAFLNTVDREAGTDELASPRGLAGWLTERAMLPAGTELDEADAKRAAAFREGLRSFLTGGSGGRLEALDDAVSTALLRARFTAKGGLAFEPASTGLDGAVARLVAIFQAAKADGLWPRFKICVSTNCRSAFYDYSTSRTGKWCRPLCGNRMSAAAYRRRKQRRSR